MIPIWKKEKPELKSIHSQVLQEIVKRVDLAFQAFFRRGELPLPRHQAGRGSSHFNIASKYLETLKDKELITHENDLFIITDKGKVFYAMAKELKL